jgi:hypothetical protein
MKISINYIAEPKHVREVSLRGTADLDYWQDRLKDEDLTLAQRDGKAQVLIVAAEMRFLGVRFREVSFSILVRHMQEGLPPDGAFLVQAFNSRRMFAFVERVLFSTPYRFGDVRVAALFPASILLLLSGAVVFQTTMEGATRGRMPARSEEDCWEGPIFLPSHGRQKDRSKLFFGRLRGHTETYPFLPSRDAAMIRPSADSEILQSLLDSHFAVEEWAVRQDAAHARSKTYKRSVFFAAWPGGLVKQ